MAKTAKAKDKPAKTKTPSATAKSTLPEVYSGVEAILKKYVPPFKVGDLTVTGKDSLQLVAPQPVAVPGAYGGKPVNHAFAAAILQKGYVGFYLMGVYSNPVLKKRISPALLKTLKGKSCFHLQALDE